MTIPEFFEKLKQRGPEFKICVSRAIRTKECRQHPGHEDVAHLLCPICDVALAETGQFYNNMNFGLAAEAIGLGKESALLIAKAADNSTNPLRNELLEACGLTEAV
jgi:hypothetical protein